VWFFTGIGVLLAALVVGAMFWTLCSMLWTNFMDVGFWKSQNDELVAKLGKLKDELALSEQLCKTYKQMAQRLAVAPQAVTWVKQPKDLEPLQQKVTGNPWLPNCS
jgi:hypothetical protein